MPLQLDGSPRTAAATLCAHLGLDNEVPKDIDILRQENADLTEQNGELEVAIGQLLKELRFLKAMLIQAGSNPAK